MFPNKVQFQQRWILIRTISKTEKVHPWFECLTGSSNSPNHSVELEALNAKQQLLPVENRRWWIFLTKNKATLLAVVSISDSIISLSQHEWKKRSHLGVWLNRPRASPAALVRTKWKQDDAGARVGAPCSGRLLVKLKEREREEEKHLISATTFHFNSCTFQTKMI